MNSLVYNLLNKICPKVEIDNIYLDNLYNLYQCGSNNLNYQIHISKEDFKKIFIIVYDVLRFKITDEEFLKVSDHCTKLLMADAQEGEYVDYKWIINHIWYLCVGTSIDVEKDKYNDCIPFIQQLLVKEFSVEENLKDKFSRKVFTKFIAK